MAPECPAVISDSAAIARLAAEHLIERGFRHFGFCGEARFAWSGNHQQHFVAALREAGYACAEFPSDPGDFADWNREQRKLAQWLRTLPKPVGIMACYDIRGQHVLDICRATGLLVPDEVAVVGQHNDDLLCELCHPPLSSVIPNARLAGREAARLLDRMMRGRPAAGGVYGIAPLGVATRQSTNVVALADGRLAAAVRLMQANACRGLPVEQAARAAGISRSLFERRFRSQLGCAPYEYVLRTRMRLARELLGAGELTIAEVAEKTGFATAEYFSAAVKKHFGASPRQLRDRLRRPL